LNKEPAMKISTLGLLAILAVQPLAVCAQPKPAAAVPVSSRIVLLVDEIKAIRNFPVVVAERLGYLKDGNFDVTVMNTRDEVPHADMLADGRVDAVMAYYHHNIVSQSEGKYSEAIVTLGVTPGVKVLVSDRAKDKFKTLPDLKGSRFIAGGAGSSKSTVASYLVLEGGGRITDYTRLGTDGKDKNVVALRDGSADFVVAPVPEGDFYEEQGVATVFADLTTVEGTKKAFGALFPSSTVFMANARVKSNPEIAQHLADAFVRTLQYINTHTAEEIAALIPVAVSGKDRVAYLKILKEELPMFANDGRMPVDGAEKEWHVLSEFNPRYKSIAVEQTFTNKFVEEALRRFP
jgi:NitT/TauT family transport system substrate-binding protein